MSLLRRYIAFEILLYAGGALVAVTFMALLREAGWVMQILVRRSASVEEVAAVIFAILPQVLRFTIPMAVLLGILIGLGRMSADRETIALGAAGVSMRQVLLPVVVLASLACALDQGLSIWIAPKTALHLQTLARALEMKQLPFEIQPWIFHQGLGNFVVFSQNIEQPGGRFRELMLADVSMPDNPTVTFARTGTLLHDASVKEYSLILSDGTTITDAGYSLLAFGSRVVKVSVSNSPGVPETLAVLGIPTLELWNHVRTGKATANQQSELHSRVALPFACFAFALIGVPVGLSTAHHGRSRALMVGLSFMMSYYFLFVGVTHFALAAEWPAFIVAWLPNFVFGAMGVLLLLRSDTEYGSQTACWLTTRIIGCRAAIVLRKLPWKRIRGILRRRNLRWSRLSILDLYVLRSFLVYFGLASFALISAVVIIRVFELLREIINYGTSAVLLAKYVLSLFPEICYETAPFAVLLSCLTALSIMRKTNEILAVKANAVSLQRFLSPLLVMAAFISVGMFCVQNYIVPFSSQRQTEYLQLIKGQSGSAREGPLYNWFTAASSIFYFNSFDRKGDLFMGLFVFRFAPHSLKLNEWISAKTGSWKDDRWTLEDGRIHRRDTLGNTTVQPFLRHSFVDENPPALPMRTRSAGSQMAYRELSRYWTALRTAGSDDPRLRVDLDRRIAFPFEAIVLALLGVAFLFSQGANGLAHGTAIAVAVGIFYWTTCEVLAKAGGTGSLSPALAVWLPNLTFGAIGVWKLLRVRT